VTYSPAEKEAYAWWFREFFDGLRAEASLPADWQSKRTILIFAEESSAQRPKAGDYLYFEIPAGIEQVTALQAEVHLFLFNVLPATPEDALARASSAIAFYQGRIEGAENRQGNREVVADWQVDVAPVPRLTRVPTGVYRPAPRMGMQQVRAEIEGTIQDTFDYRFERERQGWDADLSTVERVSIPREKMQSSESLNRVPMIVAETEEAGRKRSPDRPDAERIVQSWRLVTGLRRRAGPAFEKDREALDLARPESGAFILVSVQRRKRGAYSHGEWDSQ
jgi:hypothetical protein